MATDNEKDNREKKFPSESALHAMLGAIGGGVTIQDLEYNVIYQNPLMKELFGERVGEKCYRAYEGNDDICEGCPVESAFRDGKLHQALRKVKMPDGTIAYWENTANPVKDETGKIVGCVEIAVNVTDRKTAEEELRNREQLFRAIAESAQDSIFCKDLNSRYTFANPAMEKLLRMPASEIIGKKPAEVFGEEGSAIIKEVDDTAFKGRTANVVRELKINGRSYHFHAVQTPLYDEKGNIRGVCGIVRDITDRILAEEKLKENEEKFRTLFNTDIFLSYVTDIKGNILLANRRGAEFMGESEESIIGKSFFSLRPDRAQMYQGVIDGIVKTGKTLQFETLFPKDGRDVWLFVTVNPVRVGNETNMQVISIDITDRKRAEEEIQKVQKLESVGILAGGIAHDFNNILTSIWGNIQLSVLRTEQSGDARTLELLRQADMACVRAQELTQQLLTFARGGEPVKRVISAAHVIKESSRFALRGSNVLCEYSIPEDLWPVDADEGQISQVIQNLVINADQAMPDGGAINISAENVSIDVKSGSMPLAGDKYIKISVRDEGHGIPEDQLTRIFDPYFSTKQKGSGLGLTTCYSIIKKHDGHITVDSELGEGSTFSFYLPAMPERDAEEKISGEIITGHGKILLLDDDEQVRETSGKILEMLGYDPDYAKDGDEAVKMYRQALSSGEPYDAVILDLTIPGGMGGRKCLDKMMEIDPEVKAIVSSGYSTDPVMSNYEKYGFKGILPKPFKITETGEILHKIVGNR